MILKIYGLKNIFLYPKFFRHYSIFKKKSKKIGSRFSIKFKDLLPYLGEDTVDTAFDTHYVYHPAWATRIIAKERPEVHIDISSSIYFVTTLSAFIPVQFYDYRPPKMKLPNLECKHGDLLSLPFGNNEIKSLSCMHVMEHIGLGRYGDEIDPDGDVKAMNELKRVLAVGGSLFFVVPVGKPKIMYNAHRIYSYEQIMDHFSDLRLKEFTLIPDNVEETGMIYNATKEQVAKQRYGCGCFWFTKD